MIWTVLFTVWLMIMVDEAVLEMSNTKITITSYLNPLASASQGQTFNVGLLEKELVELLAGSLNLTWEVRPPRDFLGLGMFENGTWTGVMGQLLRGEVDLSVSSGELTPRVNALVDATISVFHDEIKILISFPETTVSSYSALIEIFSSIVWSWIFISTAVVIAAFWIMSRLKLRPEKPSVVDVLLYIYGLLMGQRDYESKRSSIIRLVCGPWCLAMLVMTSIYRGTLTSMLTAPKYQFVVSSIDDVARNEEIMPHVWKYSPAHQFIMTSPLSACQVIRDRFKKHPELLKVKDDFTSTVLSGKHNVFIASSYLLNFLVAENAFQSKQCRLAVAKKPVSTRKMSMFLPKNSPFTKSINKELLRFQDAGLLDYLRRKHMPRATDCDVPDSREKSKGTKRTQLKLKQLAGAFLILFVGMSAAFFVFIFELCIQRYQRRKRTIKVKSTAQNCSIKTCAPSKWCRRSSQTVEIAKKNLKPITPPRVFKCIRK